MVPYLESRGFEYVREEYARPLYGRIAAENLSYAKFSAGYGNIYTARQLLQLLRRCTGQWTPVEDRWAEKDKVIDPFRPGLRYYARSHREFDLLTSQHLHAVRRAFEAADVFVFTLGLTEAWISKLDGAVFPACPGTVAGTFDPARHEFANFTVSEVRADLSAAIAELRRLNPRVDVILTVSPVPLVATADGGHVLLATTYSKSVLRVAADEVVRSTERVSYFPAYEIVTGKQLPAENLHIKPIEGLQGVKEASLKITGAVPAWSFLEGVTVNVAVAHGLSNARKVIERMKSGEANYHFVEVMTCPGGCIGGGGQPRVTTDEVRMKRIGAIYREDEGKKLRKSHENPEVAQIYKEFLGKPLGEKSHHLLHTHYKSRGRV